MSEFDVVTRLAQGDRLISQKEVAERLGTSRRVVKKLLDAGQLPCIRFGRYARVSVLALNKFIRESAGRDLLAANGGIHG